MSALWIRVELFFPLSHSLKEKRSILRSLRDKLSSSLKVSVAETEFQDLWQRCTLEIAFVNSDTIILKKTSDRIYELISSRDDVEVSFFDKRLIDRWDS